MHTKNKTKQKTKEVLVKETTLHRSLGDGKDFSFLKLIDDNFQNKESTSELCLCPANFTGKFWILNLDINWNQIRKLQPIFICFKYEVPRLYHKTNYLFSTFSPRKKQKDFHHRLQKERAFSFIKRKWNLINSSSMHFTGCAGEGVGANASNKQGKRLPCS